MKKRNPLVVFLLSVITLGIYDIYWLVSTKKVLNAKTSHKIPTIWLLVVPAVMIIAGYILLFAGGLHTTTTYSGGQETSHIAHAGTYILSFVLIGLGFFLSFFISAYWFFKFSKAVNEYTQEKMGTAVTFLILWLIHLIGVALIQDTFNDMGEVSGGYNPNSSGPTPQTVNPGVASPPSIGPSQPPTIIGGSNTESPVNPQVVTSPTDNDNPDPRNLIQ